MVVMAESLFEAAAMALRAFNTHGCPPGPAARLRVQVTPPAVTHIVTVQKVEDWLKGGARSPREAKSGESSNTSRTAGASKRIIATTRKTR